MKHGPPVRSGGVQKLSGAVFCTHTRNCGKTDHIVSNQWRISIIYEWNSLFRRHYCPDNEKRV